MTQQDHDQPPAQHVMQFSAEATALLAQLRRRDDVDEAGVTTTGYKHYTAWARGRDRAGRVLALEAYGDDPEDALLLLVSRYRVADRLQAP